MEAGVGLECTSREKDALFPLFFLFSFFGFGGRGNLIGLDYCCRAPSYPLRCCSYWRRLIFHRERFFFSRVLHKMSKFLLLVKT